MGYDEYIYKGDLGQENEKVMIDFEHHEIHEGNHYVYSEVLGPLAASATSDVLIEVPTGTAEIHLNGLVELDQAFRVQFYEGASYSGFGTTATAWNSNRRSSNTTAVKLGMGPTLVTTGANLLFDAFSGGRRMSGLVDRAQEFILDEGQKYLLRVIAESASATGYAELLFYEYE